MLRQELGEGYLVIEEGLNGIHFEKGEHQKLGRAVAARVREILR